MKRKYIVWAFIVLLLAAFVYGYWEYNRQRGDSKSMEPKFSTEATALLQEFISNEPESNKKYAGQNIIVAVSGLVKEVVKDEKGHYTILLGDTTSLSSVRCSMDTLYSAELSELHRGSFTKLKGNFNGYKADELGIGADIELNFCVRTERK
jgi:hypothetical protein